jgi:hypothetical protein
MDTIRAEVERCEALPPLALAELGGCGTVAATKSSRPPRQCGPRDGIGASLPKALGQHPRATRVLFGGTELAPAGRWDSNMPKIERTSASQTSISRLT